MVRGLHSWPMPKHSKRQTKTHTGIFIWAKSPAPAARVFDNLEIRAITTDEINALERAYHGLDFGFAIDPDAYVKMGFRKMGRELFIHGECGDVRMGLDKLAKSVKQHAGADRVVCDSAAPREIHELRLRGINAAPAYKPPGQCRHDYALVAGTRQNRYRPQRCAPMPHVSL